MSRHLKPGGYFEHLEFSIETNADPNSENHADKMYTQFSRSIIGVGEEKTGMTFKTVENMVEYMRGAGTICLFLHCPLLSSLSNPISRSDV